MNQDKPNYLTPPLPTKSSRNRGGGQVLGSNSGTWPKLLEAARGQKHYGFWSDFASKITFFFGRASRASIVYLQGYFACKMQIFSGALRAPVLSIY